MEFRLARGELLCALLHLEPSCGECLGLCMRRRNPPLSVAHHALATAAAASQEIVDLSERHVELLLERRILLLELRLATHLVDGGHVLNGLRVHREPQR